MKKILYGIICTLFLTTALINARTKPNVLIIYTDDQGYTDIGCFGAKDIKTPNLDNLAKEGIQLTSYYSSSCICTPSRAALQTGKYFVHVKGGVGLYWPSSERGMDPEEVTIGDALRTQDYKTALIGKWHLGHLSKFLPTNNGYDYYFGVPYSNDMWIAKNMKYSKNLKLNDGYTLQDIDENANKRGKYKGKVPLMRNEEVIEYPADQSMLTERYTDETIKFIEESKAQKKPFYICLNHNMPHNPLHVSDRFKDTSERGLYGDVIQEIDFNVGRIVKYLKDNNMFDNTIIFFASDNGPTLFGKNKNGTSACLRNGKFSFFEGGFRVPAIISYPAKFQKDTISDAMISSIDILPTIAKQAGVEKGILPADIDGQDMSDFLMGKVKTSPRTSFMYYSCQNEYLAVRKCDYKLMMPNHNNYTAQFDVARGYVINNGIELFNLSSDLAERHNLSEDQSDIVEELSSVAKVIDNSKPKANQLKPRTESAKKK